MPVHEAGSTVERGQGGDCGGCGVNKVILGDCRDVMRSLIAEGVRVQTIVTSPPYYGLRNYGLPPSVWGGDADCSHEWGDVQRTPWANAVKGPNSQGKNGGDYANGVKEHGQWCQHCGAWRGCFGLEPDYRMYVAHSVEIFDLARQLLADDGTLWLNLGDSYATGAGKAASPGGGAQGEKFLDIGPSGYRGGHAESPKHAGRSQVPDAKNPGAGIPTYQPNRMPQPGLKPKDLMGVPWRVAFALQDAGWWLRQDIVWSKPNPMPESVTDRCTKAHEYLFLMAKSERYYYDAEAIKEPASDNTHARRKIVPAGWAVREGPHTAVVHQTAKNHRKLAEPGSGTKNNSSFDDAMAVMPDTRNKRSVWTIATQPYPEAHFATFPEALVGPCILAGSRPGDIVFDPFMGSGTVASVAQRLGRRWLGSELNGEYVKLIEARTKGTLGLELPA